MDDEKSPIEEIEELKGKVAELRQKSLFLKFHKDPNVYEEFVLCLESAEFYLDRLAVPYANEELVKAISTFKK
jgi:pyridoxine/pyridoxamine 5'-phosphate oxidase